MDEINDFFDFSKEFTRKTIPQGCISGSVAVTAGVSRDSQLAIQRDYIGTDYTKTLVEEELIKLNELDINADKHNRSRYCEARSVAASSCMDELDALSNASDSESEDNPTNNRVEDDIYDRYVFDTRRDDSLPIHDKKNEIVNAIRSNPVVILEGDTGCGKTTQVPQYILDEAYKRREHCKIICTQPRRIAAISIARRVSSERKWEEGTVVGYQVGLHANLSEDTRILYCTTGVLLQKLVREKSLKNCTHIILDEVHERDQDMDFLLFVIRRLLTTNSKQVKVILMSATINTTEFAKYFTINRKPAPVVKADCRRNFQVKEYYLNDLSRINSTDFSILYEEPGISPNMYNLALKLIIIIDNIEKQECLQNNIQNLRHSTSILIFLPGINEIDQMWKKIEKLNISEDTKLYPIRLHSLIAPEEQIRIFGPAPKGFRKIILSTNIAESSITVPDVKFVIDFCLSKSLVTDSASNFSCLQLHWASRANCKQRSGRAGRVMNGRVYRLVSKNFFMSQMDEFSMPEMLRCPLENIALKAKLLEMGPPPDILGLTLSPPNLSDVYNTILTLKELGALYTTVNGVYTAQDGDISYIGRIMAALPIDIRLSRLIVLGYVFSCMDEAIIMAAGLSVRSIFRFEAHSPQSDCDAYVQKLVWADGSGSDLLAMLKAYKVWISMREQNTIREDESERIWAKRYFINIRSLREMHLLVQELKVRLQSANLREQTSFQRVRWLDRELTIILKIVIAGAFYPNYFTRTNLNETDRERSMYHILCGNDPLNTVYFTNFTNRHIRQLYSSQVKDLFKTHLHIQTKDIEVKFQEGSEKCFVTFKNDLDAEYDDASNRRLVVPGKVKPDIYKAVRMRLSRLKLAICAMEHPDEIKYAEERGYGQMVNGAWQMKQKELEHIDFIVLPSVFKRIDRGWIKHIEHCSKFFFLPECEYQGFRRVHDLLNDSGNLSVSECIKDAANISIGMMLLAPLDDIYCRAKILRGIHRTTSSLQFQVFFIDHGCASIVRFDELRKFPKSLAYLSTIPPRVYECRLAMVQPSTVKSANGRWSNDATELMQKVCDSLEIIELEIFSVVESVANVFIKIGNNATFNDELVKNEFARKTDENYLSKIDYDLRLRKQSMVSHALDVENAKQNREYLLTMLPNTDIVVKQSPPLERCPNYIKLRGPFSPLETKTYAAIRAGTWKSVSIERESVNSVLLDTDPQDVHERLLVAAGISEVQDSGSIVARATTLMPNIHGFGALMTLLFCPTVQTKCNKNKNQYAALLAGLGCNEKTAKPLYGEHDVILNLDVALDQEDFLWINNLRYCMDSMLYTEASDDKPNYVPKEIADIQAKIKDLIIKLLSKNREYVETHTDVNDNTWEIVDAKDILDNINILGERSIFPMLCPLKLKQKEEEAPEDREALKLLWNNCQELHNCRHFDGTIRPLKCLLCKQTLENIVELRIHLLSQLHRDREHQIEFVPKRS